MATKWKNFTRSCWVKAAVYILIAALTGLSAWRFSSFLFQAEAHYGVMDARMLFQKELPPEYLISDLTETADHLIAQSNTTDEASIQAGETIDEYTLAMRMYNKFAEYCYDTEEPIGFSVFPAESEDTAMTAERANKIAAKAMQQGMFYDDEEAKSFCSWLLNNPGVEEVCRQELITEQLEEYSTLSDSNSFLKGYAYYVYDKESNTVLQNIGAADAEAAKKILYDCNKYPLLCELTDNHTFSLSGTAIDAEILKEFEEDYYPYLYYDSYNAEDVVLVAFKAEALDTMQTEWRDMSTLLQQTTVILILCVLLTLIGLVMLCFGAGRKQDDAGVYLHPFDRIWSEVQVTTGVCIFGFWCSEVILLAENHSSIPTSTIYTALVCGSIAAIELILMLGMSQVRRIKAKQWLDGFITIRLCRRYVMRAARWLAAQFRKSPLRQRVIILAVLVPLASCFWFTIPFIIAGLLYFGMRGADSFEAVAEGAKNIRDSKTDTHITLAHGSKEIRELADNLNSISDGLGKAVDTAVKSERLKAELISNVSHDIKTPLTSIITYIDLLKKCDMSDPTAREYVEILDQKAQRLRILTLDLFDASKASSGAMKVDLMQTDFDALLRQAVGERSEHLEKANLDVRIQSKPPIYVSADGRLLWRILDNLLSNCARYALPGSRVYITLDETDNTAVLTMKNISANELNISCDELMERFTRGDRSRHTEGSGLGLSIARSLAELMHGSCRVEIDGDLFKAVVTIPKWIQA